jgi:hypothetical protein
MDTRICRDINEVYLGAYVAVFMGTTEPPNTRISSCREANVHAKDLALSRMMVVSDCKTVVTDIAEGTLGNMQPSSSK